MSDVYSSGTAQTSPSSNTGYRKPLPVIDPWNKAFWDATQDALLMAQEDASGKVWFPPSPISPFNPSMGWCWKALSGEGVVVSWVVFHQNYFAGFKETLPYVVALVRLNEGPLLYTNLVDLQDAKVSIGMTVSVRFQQMDGNRQLPVFAPGGKGAR